MRRARILKRGPRLFIHTASKTAEGFWLMAAPVVVAELSESETFLGEAIADALAASRSGARDATDAVRKQILEKARAKKWPSFLRETVVCDIEKDEAGVRFFPARSGFQRRLVPTTSPRFVLPSSAGSDEIGTALKAAFRAIGPRRRRPAPARRPR